MTERAIFWFCLGVIAWETAIFPALLWLLARLRPKPAAAAEITPAVSIVIAAHNEAAHIAQKIENTLALDYPPDRMEILVADDASDDGTDRIALTFAARGVKLVRQEEWKGKTAAQNLAVSQARGEIILFSDATALYDTGALRRMVRHFADPKVGCVTGRVILGKEAFSKEGGSLTAAALESRLRYEQEVRKAQGEAFSLFGASGCIYAVRRSLYLPLPEDQVSDLVLPLLLLEQGYRTAYEAEAVATLQRPVSAEREFHRRSRVVLQCLRAMWYMRRLLLPWRSGPFTAAVAWYRLLRWLLPLFLLALLITNSLLAIRIGSPYIWFLAAQAALYGLAVVGGILEALKIRAPFLGIPFFFLWINLAAGAAIARMIAGEKAAAWRTDRRA